MPNQKKDTQEPEIPVVSVPLPKRNERRRLVEVLVRMPLEDKEAVQRLADAAGLSISAWCRAVIQSVIRQAGKAPSGGTS